MKSLRRIILLIALVTASQLFGASIESNDSAVVKDSSLADVHAHLAAAKKRFDEAHACYILSQESVVVDPDLKYVDAYLPVAREFSESRLHLVTIQRDHDALGCQCESGSRLELTEKSLQKSIAASQAAPAPAPAPGGLVSALGRIWSENLPVLFGGTPD